MYKTFILLRHSYKVSERTLWVFNIFMFFIEGVKYSFEGSRVDIIEALLEAGDGEEEGRDLPVIVAQPLTEAEAGPEVGEVVPHQLVLGVDHHVVVREEQRRLYERK